MQTCAPENSDAHQDVDKVNRLPDAEKPCKTRKHGLQMRAHTQAYVTDFAARVDEVSRNFNFSRSCSRNFCGCGVCQWSDMRRKAPTRMLI